VIYLVVAINDRSRNQLRMREIIIVDLGDCLTTNVYLVEAAWAT